MPSTYVTNLYSGGLDDGGRTLLLAASDTLLGTWLGMFLIASEVGISLMPVLEVSTTDPPLLLEYGAPLRRFGGSTVVTPPFRIFSSSQLKPGSSCAKRRPFSCIWAVSTFCFTSTATDVSSEKKTTTNIKMTEVAVLIVTKVMNC